MSDVTPARLRRRGISLGAQEKLLVTLLVVSLVSSIAIGVICRFSRRLS